jgi:hypothetical protein
MTVEAKTNVTSQPFGYDRHADETVNIAIDPAFNNLHPVPAFQQLLAKVGLPPVK